MIGPCSSVAITSTSTCVCVCVCLCVCLSVCVFVCVCAWCVFVCVHMCCWCSAWKRPWRSHMLSYAVIASTDLQLASWCVFWKRVGPLENLSHSMHVCYEYCGTFSCFDHWLLCFLSYWLARNYMIFSRHAYCLFAAPLFIVASVSLLQSLSAKGLCVWSELGLISSAAHPGNMAFAIYFVSLLCICSVETA